MIVGYARVSTDGQTLDAQQSALTQAGAEKVFAEKVSGAVTDRKQLAKAIAALGPGDVLLVTRLTALHARPAICSTCSMLWQRPGLAFGSLADSWADTTTAHGRTYADDTRGPCGVRAQPDPCEDQRGPHPGQGKGSEVRPQAGADPAPTTRSSGATSSGGEPC